MPVVVCKKPDTAYTDFLHHQTVLLRRFRAIPTAVIWATHGVTCRGGIRWVIRLQNLASWGGNSASQLGVGG